MMMLRQISYFALLSLVIDALPFVAAAIYAARPTEGRLALMRPLSLAALFAGAAGTLNGVLNTFHWIYARPEIIGHWGQISLALAETMVPVVFGLTCLTAAWLLVAVGMWRGLREA
jgi:hypothetical protein